LHGVPSASAWHPRAQAALAHPNRQHTSRGTFRRFGRRIQQPLVLDMAAGARSAAESPGIEPRSSRRGVCKPRFCTRNGSRVSALTSSSRGYCTQLQLCLCTQWQQRLLMRLETVLQQQNSEAVAAFTAFSEIEFLRAGTGAAASAPGAAAAASALICSSRLCAQKQQLLQRT
jgi:hypothetical protein